MHKDSNSYPELMKSWKEGWKDYIEFPKNDIRPLTDLSIECARILRVDIDTQPGYIRTLAALKNIAAYCERTRDWRDKNLYTINQCISTIMQEMTAEKKRIKEEEEQKNLAERIYQNQKNNREKADKEMELQRLASKKWYEENWDAEKEKAYKDYMERLKPAKVISIGNGKDNTETKAM